MKTVDYKKVDAGNISLAMDHLKNLMAISKKVKDKLEGVEDAKKASERPFDPEETYQMDTDKSVARIIELIAAVEEEMKKVKKDLRRLGASLQLSLKVVKVA